MKSIKFLDTEVRTQQQDNGEVWVCMNDIYEALGGTLRVKGHDVTPTVIMPPEQVEGALGTIAPDYVADFQQFMSHGVNPAYYAETPSSVN